MKALLGFTVSCWLFEQSTANVPVCTLSLFLSPFFITKTGKTTVVCANTLRTESQDLSSSENEFVKLESGEGLCVSLQS